MRLLRGDVMGLLAAAVADLRSLKPQLSQDDG